MIKKILVTTDFSETSQTAFDLAQQMAEKFGGSITLLHVQELHLPPLVLEGSSTATEQIEQEHKLLAEARVRELAQRMSETAKSAVVVGTPHLEIDLFAKQHDFDLIVMATHGRGFFSHAILGSTTERVVRHAPCPVLTIRDDTLHTVDD